MKERLRTEVGRFSGYWLLTRHGIDLTSVHNGAVRAGRFRTTSCIDICIHAQRFLVCTEREREKCFI